MNERIDKLNAERKELEKAYDIVIINGVPIKVYKEVDDE